MNQEHLIRQNLAAAYQIFAQLSMDDLTYTHLSARSPEGNSFYIYPFGHLFEEVTASSLLEVSLDGKILQGSEYQYNQTGYIIHGSIYQHKPQINAIFHLHTSAGVAVSAMQEGLLPISQFSLHFYENLGYHDYDSLVLNADISGNRLVNDLSDYNAMLLKNHGTLSCGATIHEAFFYAYYLEQACKVQCLALNGQSKLHLPTAEICRKARQDMRNFEPDLGKRDWLALIRKLERNGSNYKE